VPEFKPWADTVPSFTYSKSVPYFQVRALLVFCGRQKVPSVTRTSRHAQALPPANATRQSA
jgi:hypothetical protein